MYIYAQIMKKTLFDLCHRLDIKAISTKSNTIEIAKPLQRNIF